MKNVKDYQIKKCIFMETDEFDRIVNGIFDGNCTTIFSTDGVEVCPDNKFLKDDKIVIDKLSEYFDTNIVSFHIDDEDNIGVWICYEDGGNDMIKNTLINAGVYEDIVEIVEMISDIKESSVPVDCYIDENNKVSSRIDVDILKHEAEVFLFDLEHDRVVKFNDEYINLWRYINDKTDMMLHNYAVDLSHNLIPSNKMTTIRKYMILENLLINISFSAGGDDGGEWSIPSGWLSDKEPVGED